MNIKFWENKRVFLTGHTGFKGSWMSLWLLGMGAKVTGYALKPNTKPNLFDLCRLNKSVKSVIGDIRDFNKLKKELIEARPEIIIHMAAQPIVRESYRIPRETYEINVMGTLNLLEAARSCKGVKAIVNVTTDKVYLNKEGNKSFVEGDPLGGYDPYSSSKACSEIVTEAYRCSFFNPEDFKKHRAAVATARAGNVIGGGDWAADRLIPDFVRALLSGKKILIRNPNAIRPWQYVLEPLAGYLSLAEKLYRFGPKYSGAWNFGPDERDCKPVGWMASKFCGLWGSSKSCSIQKGKHPHEANFLKLNNSKAKKQLGWHPKWDVEIALEKVVEWTKAYEAGVDVKEACIRQINEYQMIALKFEALNSKQSLK